MRQILSGYLQWVTLGAGMLVLAGGVSVSVWLWQRDDGSGPAPGTNGEAPAGLERGSELPGLPVRNTTADETSVGANPASSGASVSDSAELEIQRGGPAPGQAEAVQSEDAGGAGQELTAANGATVSDSAELEVQRGEPPPPRGGPGDAARVQDSADLVVRDASGNIKQQKTVK